MTHDPTLIIPDYQVIDVTEFANNKFSVAEKEQIKDLGLSQKILNSRYSNIQKRSLKRSCEYIPNRYRFIRAFLHAIKKESARTGKSAKAIFDTYEIHSIDRLSYRKFQLVPYSLHISTHNKNKLYQCGKCKQWYKMQDMAYSTRSKNKKSKVLCRFCLSKQTVEKRKLKKEGK